MNIVITMAGLGSRFREAGYAVPKYQIEAHGKTLFEWSMVSLAGFHDEDSRYFFIVRKEDGAAAFIRKTCGKLGIKNPCVIEIGRLTDGQATTALLAAEHWDAGRPLLVYNIDTFVKPGAMRAEEIRGDGFIPCFHGEGDHWSFVRLDETGRAVEVREKQRISDNCTLGAYYFKTARSYEALYREFFALPESLEKGERYIAPMYNHLIRKGGEVYISVVPREDVYVLGTPGELDYFIQNYKPEKPADKGTVELREVDVTADLELIMAWRANPEIYKWFNRQTGPLRWDEHVKFWSGERNRKDWMILYDGRRVGVVSAVFGEMPDVGIMVGETTLWGRGVAKRALRLAIGWLKEQGYAQAQARIKDDNQASRILFESVGFTYLGPCGGDEPCGVYSVRI